MSVMSYSPPRRGNVVGVIALALVIVGGAATALVFVLPAALFLALPLLLAGFIMAIIGLSRRGAPKATSIVALVLSVVLGLTGPVLFGASFVTFVTQSLTGGTSEGGLGAPSGQGSSASGTRQHPNPLGSTITGDDWKVTVHKVDLNANKRVAAGNMFNDAPPKGKKYIVVNYTVVYTGGDSGTPAEVGVAYVTPGGVTINSFDSHATLDSEMNGMTKLYPGAKLTGTQVFLVPAAHAGSGTVALTPGIASDTSFVAVK